MATARSGSRRNSEASRIALLQRVLGSAIRGVEVGIGDDAAVLRAGKRGLVWTIDSSVQSVHFQLEWLTAYQIGYRATQAAVSDLAAMGAKPLALLSDLALPRDFSSAKLRELARGQATAARENGCAVVGGNLTRGDHIRVTTTALGEVDRPLLRLGARAGDELWLIGEVGLARAGLLLCQQSWRGRDKSLRRCIEAWRAPHARVSEGKRLVTRAHAAIDISDGLGQDAAHLAEASKLRVVVDAELLLRALRPELHTAANVLGESPLQLALIGGEDYALLAAGPSKRRPRWATPIGHFEKGQGAQLQIAGKCTPLNKGFDHFTR